MNNAPVDVSLILPVRNEAAAILQGLQAIAAQDYGIERLEILISDGMSTDNTRAIIRDFATDYPWLKLRILDNPGSIVSTGMNLALRRAQGEIIIRVDGHTVIGPDYVRKCVDALKRTNADNVGGRMNATGSNSFGRAVALAASTPFGIGGSRFHYSQKEEWVDTVYMGAWPRQIFEKIGLFDEELIRDQDDEFNYRLRELGGHILLSPVIHSEYTVRSTACSLWRQYYQYGYWKVRVLQKHPRQMSLRQFIPPVFVLALLISAFCAFSPVPRSFSLVIPLLYLLANLLASLYVASQHGWSSLLYLPLAFAIIHLGYGLGFWVGLIKFWNRWGDKLGKSPVWSSETVG